MNVSDKSAYINGKKQSSSMGLCSACDRPLMWAGAVCTYCDQDYQKGLAKLHVNIEQNGRYVCPACHQNFDTPSQEMGLSAHLPWYQACLYPKGCPHCKTLLLWKPDGFKRNEKISSRSIIILSFLLVHNPPENLRIFFSSWWSLGTFYTLLCIGMLSASLIDKSLWKHGENGVWIPHPVIKRSEAIKLYLLAFVGLITLVLFFTTPKAIATPIWFFLLSVFAAITASNLIRWHRNRVSKRTQAS